MSDVFNLVDDEDEFLLQDVDHAFMLSPPLPNVPGTTSEPPVLLATLPDAPKIRVIVRKRPLNKKELERAESDVLECDAAASCLYLNAPRVTVDLTPYIDRHSFRFDDVFDEHVDNDQLYERAIQPLVGTAFRGGKGTVFAYGQTGSGKTFTMSPLPLRTAADIFNIMAQPSHGGLSLHVSCYEIYGGKVFDLLNGRAKLEVREDGRRQVQVVGLREVAIGCLTVLQQLCDHSAAARSTGSTGANDESSRSHSILCFALRATSEPQKTLGKLSFIDLAGSERGADTYDNDKQTRLEGAEINKSLLALKECIRALDADARHIPFRGSKLTEVLRDSFVGKNARTVMIANVSPNSGSCEHTLNTLRYADRVKEIRKPGSADTASREQLVQQGPPQPAVVRQQPAPVVDVPTANARTSFVDASRPIARPANTVGGFPVGSAAATEAPAPAAPVAAVPSVRQQPATHFASAPTGNATRRQTASMFPEGQQEQAQAVGTTSAVTSAGRNELSSSIMAAEDDLITAHRHHIEECMGSVRDEMNLLANLDGSSAGGDIERYCRELSGLLAQKQASLAQLQLRLHTFQELWRTG
ncbi:hypothetical protein D9Q98_002563 [Chlorella vulgaris]|uniref:Kinesin-like protein n=1 Tax=Chlorella vulgaris TaxID=3077 RepID=A0A9D4TTP6_CHLVU|nr:hypothetical protein D9Q98_002563 [Chlorella vulgaris]